jgi:amidohydrolase
MNIDDAISHTLSKVIAWRRDIHEHPELSNREVRTSKLVAAHLKALGLRVETGIAHTGVVGLLQGAKPGPTIALRADMDALPVTEKTEVPFKSRATASYRGDTVGVMHACGHDAHTAILMGVAETLAALRDSLHGNVLFIFQPAEEGAPSGEEGGASLMLKQGVLERHRPDALFGMHVWSALSVGQIGYRRGPLMAASDAFRILVKGRQAHGSRPWQAIDPVVTSAQIVSALQTIVSRRVRLTEHPAVLSIGLIKGGVRNNIIPDQVEMIGTLRTFTPEQRASIIETMKQLIEHTALANGATAELAIEDGSNPVLVSDVDLTIQMVPTLQRVAGAENVREMAVLTASEDFAWFAQKVPSVYFFVGITPPDQSPESAPSNHSEYFYIDERGIALGLRAMTQLALDYLQSRAAGD